MKCSQRGNISFPTWELLIPKVGTIRQLLNEKHEVINRQSKALILKQEASDREKYNLILHPSHFLLESLCIKGFQDVRDVWNPSHKSHISSHIIFS